MPADGYALSLTALPSILPYSLWLRANLAAKILLFYSEEPCPRQEAAGQLMERNLP
jgi:hypothetical protein